MEDGRNKVVTGETVPENDVEMTAEQLNEITRIRRDKLKELQDAGNDPFHIVQYDKTHSSVEIIEQFEQLEGTQVSIAGRLMSKRGMGKAGFCDVQDRDGKIQIYVKVDEIGQEAYDAFKKYDIGDLVGVKGEVFRTHKGEISVKVSEIVLLAKALLPLPEKFHGLKDPDLRYRQRYVDLIVNPGVRKTFLTRSKIIRSVRKFLDDRGFLEVDTPLLNSIVGGANARPFITHHNTLDIDLYLRIAPELYLKRLIVGGMERVYEMGRMFRNEGMSIKHNPEFSMMEVYQAYTDYKGMMELTEQLVAFVCEEAIGSTQISYQGVPLDLTPPWRRMSMTEAVLTHTGLDFSNIADDTEAARQAGALFRERGVKTEIKAGTS